MDWLIGKKGQNYIDTLRIKAHQTSKMHAFEKEILLGELNRQIGLLEAA